LKQYDIHALDFSISDISTQHSLIYAPPRVSQNVVVCVEKSRKGEEETTLCECVNAMLNEDNRRRLMVCSKKGQ
jgi:hypothetical protein